MPNYLVCRNLCLPVITTDYTVSIIISQDKRIIRDKITGMPRSTFVNDVNLLDRLCLILSDLVSRTSSQNNISEPFFEYVRDTFIA